MNFQNVTCCHEKKVRRIRRTMIIRRNIKPSGFFVLLLVLSFLPLSSILFTAIEVSAASRYVKPSAEVVVRRGAGNEYKIIAMVKDGDAVELLNEGDSHSLVRLANGKEGWMLKRFLSVEPPLSTIVESLRAENEKLKQAEIEKNHQIEEVSENLARTESQLQSILSEREQILADYQTLQADTADVVKIKEDMLRATEENEVLVQEMASLKEENNKLNKEKSINWFLAGGGVLLVGMSIGRLSSKSRKRKSSLM
jgi:SH3 domain protein